MRKLFILAILGLLLTACLSSCFHHGNDLCIKISDDDDEFEMDASYSKRKTHAVEVYIDEHLLNESVSIRNKRGDEIILDDDTKFNLRSYPGRLSIKFDKTENPEEAYEKIREVCEDLKEILDDN
jgi:hypothetical protein